MAVHRPRVLATAAWRTADPVVRAGDHIDAHVPLRLGLTRCNVITMSRSDTGTGEESIAQSFNSPCRRLRSRKGFDVEPRSGRLKTIPKAAV